MQTTNDTSTYTIVMPIALPPLQNFTDVEKSPSAAVAPLSKGTEFRRTNKKTTDPPHR